MRSFIPLLLSFLPVILAAPSQTVLSSHTASCEDYEIEVHVSRTSPSSFVNRDYSLDVLYSLANKEILVSNSYTLSARLCMPLETNSRHYDTLQVLLHGATFNKNMWDSQYEPEKYSWVRRMQNEGYPTLAVDLVGNGNSTFPDGILETQTQTYVETTHDLIQQLRGGALNGRTWEKIVMIGFSIGAITANSLATQYPADVDAMVLHGISWDSSWIYPAFLAGLQAPAQQVDEDRWGHIPPTYQTQSTIEGRIAACFGGEYDEGVVEYDWQNRDFDALGAALTFVYHLGEAPQFQGPVFLGIGDLDATFCGGRLCGSQPYALYDIFPQAEAHDIKVYENTGHLILFHHAVGALMDDTLAFLERHDM